MPQAILTCDPDSVDLARHELKEAAPASQIENILSPGVLLAELGDSYWEFAEKWHQQSPIFVRHLCPVQTILPLHSAERDLDDLVQAIAVEFNELIDPELSFSVQTRILSKNYPLKPFDVNTALANQIQESTSAPLDVRKPLQIMSVVVAQNPPVAYLGLSPTMLNISDWAGGMRRFMHEDNQISRAEFKLLEALDLFKIELPVRGVALDLGAAPGGWTRILRQKGQYVTAIDTARLDARLKGDEGIRYLHMTAQAYLKDEPDFFDIIVNDMRMDARDSARIMVSYATYLYPHGTGLMTLKLPEEDRQPILKQTFDILRKAYTVAGARQLFHNRSEITVYLKHRER
ncbi:MAG: 50S rRNA methyltransferase [Chloroflexi bacterium]|nr:50S rRNA methyltransferase [Chloroflexota bacterium]